MNGEEYKMSEIVEVFSVEQVKKCLEEVTGEDKVYALALLDWAIGKRSLKAIPLRDNTTNGDIQKAILPEHWEYGTNGEYVHVWGDGQSISFTLEWWNSPYKRGIEDGTEVS